VYAHKYFLKLCDKNFSYVSDQELETYEETYHMLNEYVRAGIIFENPTPLQKKIRNYYEEKHQFEKNQ
jgi:hypothetical protein